MPTFEGRCRYRGRGGRAVVCGEAAVFLKVDVAPMRARLTSFGPRRSHLLRVSISVLLLDLTRTERDAVVSYVRDVIYPNEPAARNRKH
jgi:hypothetical protein